MWLALAWKGRLASLFIKKRRKNIARIKLPQFSSWNETHSQSATVQNQEQKNLDSFLKKSFKTELNFIKD
jgi:hypothetical protein